MRQRLFILITLFLLVSSSSHSVPPTNAANSQDTHTNFVKDLVIIAKSSKPPYIKGIRRGFTPLIPSGMSQKEKKTKYDLIGKFSESVTALIVDGKKVQASKGKIRLTIILDNYQEKVIKAQVQFRDESVKTIEIEVRFPEHDTEKVIVKLNEIRFHAIVIGINNYNNIDNLKTPVNDAEEVARLLSQKYGFETTLIINKNATRKKILATIKSVSYKLEKKDALLIYYAGHGVTEKRSNSYYWQPVDAESESDDSWIDTSNISKKLSASKSNNILVISDSCYAGSWSTNRDIIRRQAHQNYDLMLKAAYTKKSRILITSGGNEPVEDGKQKHSVFAKSLIQVLNSTKKQAFTASYLFSYIKEPVSENTLKHQVPLYIPLGEALHEAGDFVFVRRQSL